MQIYIDTPNNTVFSHWTPPCNYFRSYIATLGILRIPVQRFAWKWLSDKRYAENSHDSHVNIGLADREEMKGIAHQNNKPG